MLDVCGTGVTMGNAEEALKTRAGGVIGDVDKNGLAEYLRTL